MIGYPLLLDLSGRAVLVAGGGTVAARRVAGLLEAGARVLVVAPHIAAAIEEAAHASGGQLHLERRAVRDTDLDGVWLAAACTDDTAANELVGAAAQARGIFCVRADDGRLGSARTPAVLRRDEITVAVNGGRDPGRASALRDAIGRALDLGDLPTRPTRPPGAPGSVGSVALVGGGPGDPDLISVRGRRLVAAADVVVVDRLAPRALLAELPDGVEVIDCGKAEHRHNLTQDEINDVLVDRARSGLRVVRLKGGDPFVFGRGGEEWLACARAGIPVTVVPGISSALAAPALAGIPLTHRGTAAQFTIISGHLDPHRPVTDGVDWAAHARGTGTLVLLMAMGRLAAIAATLVAHGRPASTPAAVVHRASLGAQRVLRAPLSQLAAAAAAGGVGSPAVVVIGEVVDVLVEQIGDPGAPARPDAPADPDGVDHPRTQDSR